MIDRISEIKESFNGACGLLPKEESEEIEKIPVCERKDASEKNTSEIVSK